VHGQSLGDWPVAPDHYSTFDVKLVSNAFSRRTFFQPLAQIIPRRKDKNPAESLAVVSSEVREIAGQEMGGLSGDGGLKDGPAFLGQLDPRRQRLLRIAAEDLQGFCQSFQPVPLVPGFQVDPCFFQGISRSNQLHPGQFPQLHDSGIGPKSGGEEDIGVQEQKVHFYFLAGRRWGMASGSRPSFLTSARARA